MGSKLGRKEAKIFANNCIDRLVTQFRTENADGSTASYSRDPDIIQNANYEQGWVENTNNFNTKIYGEDMNAVGYVQSYLLKYLYENGIPEWSATTEYFEHSICRVDNRLFISLTDNNINNDPTSTVNQWSEIPLSAINITTSGTGSSFFSSSTGNDITLKSLSVDGYASLQDNGDQINIHVLGGSGIVDAFWGQIQGTLTNQADLVSALGDKQDNLTFDSPLSVDVSNEVSIPKATGSISGYLDSTDFQTFAGKQNALTGLTHTYTDGTDTVELYPSATNSNIGTTTYPITNVNASNVNANAVTSSTVSVNTIQGKTTSDLIYTSARIVPSADNSVYLGYSASDGGRAFTTVVTRKVGEPSGTSNRITFADTNGGNVTYDCGIGGEGNYGSHVFKVGAGDKLTISGAGMTTDVNIVPNTDNNRDIGSASKRFANLYSNNSTADWNKSVYNSSTYTSSMKFGTAYYKRGSQDDGEISQILNITSDAPIINDGSTNTYIFPYAPGSSLTGIRYNYCNLGKSSNRFSNMYSNGVNIARIYNAEGGAHLYGSYQDWSPSADNALNLGYFNAFKMVKSYTFQQASDVRNKENIKNYDGGILDKIKNLTPITYNAKGDEDKRTRLGLSAQELREIEPLCVSGIKSEKKDGEETNLGIDLYSLCTLSIKAIKELNEKVESLEARVAELEGKNSKELEK